MDQLKYDLVLFANDLPEYRNTPAGRAVTEAFYASDWGDYDMPESRYMAAELGGITSTEADTLRDLLYAYWQQRSA